MIGQMYWNTELLCLGPLLLLVQMDRDGVLRLQKYSYGNDCTNLLKGAVFPRSYHESCNMAMYGSETVPEYNMTKITAPQAYFSGTLDIMSTPEDVVEQQKRLAPNVLSAHFVYERYSHMDFVWDRNALYKADMVDLLYRFSPGTMSVPGKTITLPDKLMP
eukprot:GHUV01022827.1.p1 GENE.GHUV01022827.1~~GHUV01022827.1.p1  ORF type:complete len:161 (+),score=29.58 GHUV01022827.1:401-883(+)